MHSRVAPSSAARIKQCPGSVSMQNQYPEPEGTEAAEGTAAHWVLQQFLTVGDAGLDEGVIAPNGVVVTREMMEGAEMGLAAVRRVLDMYGPTTVPAIEVPLKITRLHAECFGTPDLRAWFRQPSGRLLLWIADYKFGHRYVEVFENDQLVCYAAGAIDEAQQSDLDVDVLFTIVQPRAFHRDGPVRHWRTLAVALRAQTNIISNAMHEALGGEPKLRVSPECRDCTARHACPALQAAAQDACDLAMRAEPLNLTDEQRGVELAYLKRAQALLDARVAANEEQILATLRRGGAVPGWGIEVGAGRKRWKMPDEKVISIGRMLGVDLAKPVEACTPNQALDKGMHPDLIAQYSEQPRGAATLVRDDGSKARRVFGGQA